MIVRFKRVRPSAIVPVYMSSGAAGADLRADIDQPLVVHPGDHCFVPTGIAIAIPPGYEGQVRSRSGLARDVGIVVLNQPGTIDSDYRGEVSLLLVHLGTKTHTILTGSRIAQLVISPVKQVVFDEVDDFERTARNGAGWGSTGG